MQTEQTTKCFCTTSETEGEIDLIPDPQLKFICLAQLRLIGELIVYPWSHDQDGRHAYIW